MDFDVVVLGSGASEAFVPVAIDTLRENRFFEPVSEADPAYKTASQTYRAFRKGGKDVLKNVRLNSSIFVRASVGGEIQCKFVIDCGATFPLLLKDGLAHHFQDLDALLLTHHHSDAMGGVSVLNDYLAVSGRTLLVYCNITTYHEITRIFPLRLLNGNIDYSRCGLKSLRFYVIGTLNDSHMPEPTETDDLSKLLPNFSIKKCIVYPFWANHGTMANAMGFIINKQLIYLSDLCAIPDDSVQYFRSIMGAQRPQLCLLDFLAHIDIPHRSHNGWEEFTDQAVELNAELTLATQIASGSYSHESYAYGFNKATKKFQLLQTWLDMLDLLIGLFSTKPEIKKVRANREALGEEFAQRCDKVRLNADGDPIKENLHRWWTPHAAHIQGSLTVRQRAFLKDLRLKANPAARQLGLAPAYDGMHIKVSKDQQMPTSEIDAKRHLDAAFWKRPSREKPTLLHPVSGESLHLHLLGSGSGEALAKATHLAQTKDVAYRDTTSLLVTNGHAENVNVRALIDCGFSLPDMIYRGNLDLMLRLDAVIITRPTPDAFLGLHFLNSVLSTPFWRKYRKTINIWASQPTLAHLKKCFGFFLDKPPYTLHEFTLHKRFGIDVEDHKLSFTPLQTVKPDHFGLQIEEDVIYSSHILHDKALMPDCQPTLAFLGLGDAKASLGPKNVARKLALGNLTSSIVKHKPKHVVITYLEDHEAPTAFIRQQEFSQPLQSEIRDGKDMMHFQTSLRSLKQT